MTNDMKTIVAELQLHKPTGHRDNYAQYSELLGTLVNSLRNHHWRDIMSAQVPGHFLVAVRDCVALTLKEGVVRHWQLRVWLLSPLPGLTASLLVIR